MEDFGELLTTSGLLVDKRITWLTFHSCFDFGYLIKSILTGQVCGSDHARMKPTSCLASH